MQNDVMLCTVLRNKCAAKVALTVLKKLVLLHAVQGPWKVMENTTKCSGKAMENGKPLKMFYANPG